MNPNNMTTKGDHMRKRSILIPSIAVLIGASLFIVHSMRAAQPTAANASPNASTNAGSKTGEAQDIIDLSSPLREVLYETTVLPISQITDQLEQTVYTLEYPIPHFYQATLIWRLTLDQAPPLESSNASSPAIGEQQSNGALDQLRIAIESGELTSLELRFEDTFEGTPAFIGFQLPSPIPPAPLDRLGAETVLLDPVQFLGPGSIVSAIALVSAPTLGLRDIPLFVDGYISSPAAIFTSQTSQIGRQQLTPQPTQPTLQPTQPTLQPIITSCYINAGACMVLPPGQACQALKTVYQYYIECNGNFTPVPSRPLSIQAGCKLYFLPSSYYVIGSCNFTRALLKFNRKCLCM
jgi:hypothetical protein